MRHDCRCDKPLLTYFDNICICRNCDSIFQKGTKYVKDILIKCAIDKMLIKSIIFHSVIIVLHYVYIKGIYNFSKYVTFRK